MFSTYLLRRWKDLHDAWYPENGWSAEIYTGHINHTHLESMDVLVNSLQKIVDEKMFLRGVYPWWNSLKVEKAKSFLRF